MANTTNKLKAIELDKMRPGVHSDGQGLYIAVTLSGAKSWTFRYMKEGKRREMGLGGYPAISLKDARLKAAAARTILANGDDPLTERDAVRVQRRSAAEEVVVAKRMDKDFEFCMYSYIDTHRAEWKNKKHTQQWENTLLAYAIPVFGTKPVGEITDDDVLAVLRPIWTTKMETGTRVRQRIEKVIAHAQGLKLIPKERANPARWNGNLDALLADPKIVKKKKGVKSHPWLHYDNLPNFMPLLRSEPSVTARALEFTILTLARTTEVIEATFEEINVQEKSWDIPASRMKGNREHRVPLVPRALAIVEEMRALRHRDEPHIFPGDNYGDGLCNNAMLALLERMREKHKYKFPHFTVHGFRSTFSTYAQNNMDVDFEMREVCIAHSVQNGTSSSYQHGDMFDKRRKVMQRWSKVVGDQVATKTAIRARSY